MERINLLLRNPTVTVSFLARGQVKAQYLRHPGCGFLSCTGFFVGRKVYSKSMHKGREFPSGVQPRGYFEWDRFAFNQGLPPRRVQFKVNAWSWVAPITQPPVFEAKSSPAGDSRDATKYVYSAPFGGGIGNDVRVNFNLIVLAGRAGWFSVDVYANGIAQQIGNVFGGVGTYDWSVELHYPATDLITQPFAFVNVVSDVLISYVPYV